MATEVILPRVDMDMESGKFSNWLVREGDSVKKGQPLFEIETDKAAMEVEAPAAGILKGITAAPGDILPVGVTIAWIAAEGEDVPSAAAPVDEAPLAKAEPLPAKADASPLAAAIPALASQTPAAAKRANGDGSIRATPLARRLAREASIDLTKIPGSGPAGRIQARDVSSAVNDASPSRETVGLYREWIVKGEATPIVLVHGFGADSAGWRPLVGRLGAQRPILALDLPGHGHSALGGTTTFDEIVDEVEKAVEDEKIDRSHWVAHSLGGAVVARLAERRPDLVASLTLLAPAGLGLEINWTFVKGFLRARSEASLGPILRLLVEDEAALGNGLAKTTLRQRQERSLEASQAAVADLAFPDGVQAIDVRAALAAYPGPIKLIAGRLDRIIPADHARAAPGNVAVHLLAGVGHMPQLEARELVARLTLDNIAAGERAA